MPILHSPAHPIVAINTTPSSQIEYNLFPITKRNYPPSVLMYEFNQLLKPRV